MPRILSGIAFGAVVCTVLVGGCIARPVVATDPQTKVNFTKSIPDAPVAKVDLLFDIDNSASMGDKQEYLSAAIPDFIARLVTPNCVGADGKATHVRATIDGTCPAGSTVEFPPVRDMHIGIVSSALGPRLGDTGNMGKGGACTPAVDAMLKGVQGHGNDQAHLLNRSSTLTNPTETPLAVAEPTNFLDWFPSPPPGDVAAGGPQPLRTAENLQTDFQGLVVGVHQFGCGIESQLESWYRFLVQPDPYESLATDSAGRAQWVGVDRTILAERAAFLRPDSLVAIVVLSDENDSEVDVRSLGGIGYKFMDSTYHPPRATSACAANPLDPACASCSTDTAPKNDAECAKDNYSDQHDWGMNMNLRHVHEEQKYGVSAQFPIERYVLGLTSTTVPNRDGEYPPKEGGEGYAYGYQGLAAGNRRCTNPLFAASLPAPPRGTDVNAWNPDPEKACRLPVGTRSPSLVFYAHIGGVPHELLQNDPSKSDLDSQSQKTSLSTDDWTRILGKNPQGFDYEGIDPHMIESFKSRSGESVPPGSFKVSDQPGADPIARNEWITNLDKPANHSGGIDLQYACTFKLRTPRDCSSTDVTVQTGCDCQPAVTDDPNVKFPEKQLPPVCDQSHQTTQLYAKAYPTIRELLLAKLLGNVEGANEGIVSSLCPIHTDDNATKDDPLYGYRPAVNAIVAALQKRLAGQCLPEKLPVDPTTSPPSVPCLVVGTFPGTHAKDDCSQFPGYSDVDPKILSTFRTNQHDAFVAEQHPPDDGVVDPSTLLTCKLKQLKPGVPCEGTTGPDGEGWCYVQPSKNCAQAILFTPNALTHDVVTRLQCLEASTTDDADAGGVANVTEHD